MEVKNGTLVELNQYDCLDDTFIIPNNVFILGCGCSSRIFIKKVILHENITEIQSDAFLECMNLEEINIPSSVSIIGERAFFNCKSLKKLIIPDSVTHIGASAFAGCENLEEIVLPKNLKHIDFRTFADCKRLKKIIIPDGVEKISFAAFYGCENLEEIVLPNSIKEVDKQLFLNCKKLKRVILPNGITTLPDEFFRGCHSLDITLPEHIIELGNSVFQDCYKLSSFPENVFLFGKDCFKNCRNIYSATISIDVYDLPDGMFDGCINLCDINLSHNVDIGERCFRNCKSLKEVPKLIYHYNKRAFENCTGLTVIDIADTTIPFGCFRGCKNVHTVLNQDNIRILEPFAFSGCESIEEFSIDATYIPAEAFSNCKKLRKVTLNPYVTAIGSRAFYNCCTLEDFPFPDSIVIIKKQAFMKCHSISSITIPASLKFFGDAAFSYMDSLENIYVSKYNKNFVTPDNKILIKQMQQKLVLYASGCKDKSYSLKNYNIELDMFEREIIKPIVYIGEYAFAGSKHLEELTICGCTSEVEHTAFNDCPNLKKLNLEGISLYTSAGFSLREHGRYYTPQFSKHPSILPFENVEFKGLVNFISTNSLPECRNVKTLLLPSDSGCIIASRAFCDCTNLTKVFIPSNISSIGENCFPAKTTVEFNNGTKINGVLQLSHDCDYNNPNSNIENSENEYRINATGLLSMSSHHCNINTKYRNNYSLYALDENTFYVEQDDRITDISKQYIDKVCSHPDKIRDNPVLFVDFMNQLIENDIAIKPFFNGILMSLMSPHSRRLLCENFRKGDNFFLEVLQLSGILDKSDKYTKFLLEDFGYVTNKINILKKYNIKDPETCHRLFMYSSSVATYEKLITTNYELFLKIVRESKLIEFCMGNPFNEDDNIVGRPNLGENLLSIINILNKKGTPDNYKFLMNKIFICTYNELSPKLINNFDENMKRLIKASKVLDGKTLKDSSQNYLDLLNLLEMIGGLEEDPVTRQRACTFITEKIFDEKLPNGENNKFRIVGDDIHRIFNFGGTVTSYNKEFATFFLENYRELFDLEREHSGIIERIYKNFDIISKTATSNKGSQRKLKVTLEKCISFLQENKFDGVTEEYLELARLLGWWYDSSNTFLKALNIYRESLEAPRNIFTKVMYDEDGNAIYDNDPANDLKEPISEFYSYEWLPKQDYYNLLLGKYCNCCAHVEGAGQGIMRASMILDNCQNLIIRNNLGEIIAKSTLYVNKKDGYAVFNNVESSLKYREPWQLKNIYNAFIRGITDFVEVYNKNNISNPINEVTIGANRNTILNFLTDDKHPDVPVLQSIKFGNYSLNGSGYSGDWSTSQRLVLKK